MTTSVAQALSTAGITVKAKRVRKIASPTTQKETTMKAPHTVPTGTMTALAAAMPKEITSGTTFFDPIDLLEDKLGHQPNLRSRVLESMAWMMDASCISQARSVLFTRYSEDEIVHNNDIDFKGFCQTVAEYIDHPSLYEQEGPEATLAMLLALRNHWHDAAANAASADDRDYKSKSLREQMEAEKVKAADIGTRVNYRKIADLEARGDSAKAERLYASYMEADALSQTQRVEGNKSLMPTILEILHVANRYAVESSRFDELPLTKQRQLTTFAVGAIDRSRTDIAKRLNRQPIAFGHLAEDAFEATEALNKVIVQKYNDVGELENVRSQVAIDIGRSEKRKAACFID